MLTKKLPLILLLATLCSYAQTPCSSNNIAVPGIINQPGTANDFPCVGLGLQDFISASAMGADEAQDSWGWTDPLDGKEYAIVALDNGTAFVDITVPTNIVYLGRLNSHSGGSNLWRDVKVYNNHAYIVSEVNDDGVQIFDLTTLRGLTGSPAVNFTEDGFLFIGDSGGGSNDGRAHNIVINEDSGYGYVVGVNRSSNSGDGPIFLQLFPDPANPTIVGEYGSSDYFHDAQVVTYDGPDPNYQGREIMIGANENNIVIVDVTNKANPVDISTISYSNPDYTHQGWFTEDKRFFILGDETDEENQGNKTRTMVFDLQRLDQASINANNPGGDAFYTYFGPTDAIDHNGYVKGNRFYLANYSAGVRVLKIDGLYDAVPSIEEVDYMDTYRTNNTAAFNGTWNVYPFFESGNLIASGFGNAFVNGDGGLYVMKDVDFDNTNPVAACQNQTVTLDAATNTVTVTAASIDNGSTDNKGIVKRYLDKDTFTCADLGANTVTLTVEDDYGNKSTCTATVTVEAPTSTYTIAGWLPTAPGPGSNAKFTNNYSTATGNISACTCEIDATSEVTVNNGDYLDIYGDITVNGDLVVQPGGSIVQTDDDAVVTKNGTINVNIVTPTLASRDFMVMGSPMTAETRTGVFTNAFLVLEFNPENFLPNAAVPAGGTNWADDDGNFYSTYTGAINPGEGYVVRPQAGYGQPGGIFNMTYELGTLNNGEVTFSNFNNNPTPANNTPNAVANPYPSAILADEFMSVNSLTALYFWEHITPPGTGLPGSNLRFDMDDISIRNMGMGMPSANGGAAPTNFISTGQGFGIRTLNNTPGTNGTITFNNSMRSTTGNNTLRRPAPSLTETITLEVRNESTGMGGFTGVAFTENATELYDEGYDTNRLATIVSLFSHLPNGGEELGIQSREAFESSITIPLGFETQIDETVDYKISISDLQGLNIENTTVYLMDHQTNEIRNLSQDSYAFSSDAGRYDNRFTLYFEEQIVLGPGEDVFDYVKVFPNPVNDVLTVVSKGSYINSVEVYDLRGRRMKHEVEAEKNSCEINLSSLEIAMYFVTIHTENGSITKKVIKE